MTAKMTSWFLAGYMILFGLTLLLPLSGTALGSVCSPPKSAARASLELRPGDLQNVHDLDTAGIRKIVSDLQGYVAGPWHLPIGLTVTELGMRYDTKFFYRKAQMVGHCVALAEAKVTVGYKDVTVYITSDYAAGTCEFNAILAHEQEHVQINRELLKAYEPKFQKAIRRVLRSKKVIFAHRKAEARSAYVKEFDRQLKRVVASMVAERNRKNGAIDTRDNYQRVLAKCDNWLVSDLQAAGLKSRSGHTGTDNPVEAIQAAQPSGAKSIKAPAEGSDIQESAGFTIVEAPTDPVKQGPKTDQDLVQQGRQLTKGNVKQLEFALKSLPYDLPTRAKLLGFYFHSSLPIFGRMATIKARRRHILWLIENHPDSSVAGLPEAAIEPSGHELADDEGYQRARELWLDQAEKKKTLL